MTTLNTLPADHKTKKPEVILCFPQSLFPTGNITADDVPSIDVLAKNQFWMTRDQANNNQNLFRQAATYGVIYKVVDKHIKIATYARTGGDEKLKSKLSVGYGGHPEIIDMVSHQSDFSNLTDEELKATLYTSTLREIDEEVHLTTDAITDMKQIVRQDTAFYDRPVVETAPTITVMFGDEKLTGFGTSVAVTVTESGAGMVQFNELKVGDKVRTYGEDVSVFTDREITEISVNDIGVYHVGFLTFVEVDPLTEAVSTNPENDKFVGWIDIDTLSEPEYADRLENWSKFAIVLVWDHYLNQIRVGNTLKDLNDKRLVSDEV